MDSFFEANIGSVYYDSAASFAHSEVMDGRLRERTIAT